MTGNIALPRAALPAAEVLGRELAARLPERGTPGCAAPQELLGAHQAAGGVARGAAARHEGFPAAHNLEAACLVPQHIVLPGNRLVLIGGVPCGDTGRHMGMAGAAVVGSGTRLELVFERSRASPAAQSDTLKETLCGRELHLHPARPHHGWGDTWRRVAVAA